MARRAKQATSALRAQQVVRAHSAQPELLVLEATLARKVQLVSRVKTGLAVRKARLESPVRMEYPDKQDLLGPLVLEVIAATRAIRAQPESKAVKVPRVLEATAATQVKRAKRAPRVKEVSSVPLAKKPTQATQAARVGPAFKATSVQPALGAIPATPVSLEKQAQPGLEARLGLGATRVLLEIPAPRAQPAGKAIAAQLETRDSKVQWDPVVFSE